MGVLDNLADKLFFWRKKPDDAVSDEIDGCFSLPDEAAPENAVPENAVPDNAVSDNAVSDNREACAADPLASPPSSEMGPAQK